jgi:hypothetical protein
MDKTFRQAPSQRSDGRLQLDLMESMMSRSGVQRPLDPGRTRLR